MTEGAASETAERVRQRYPQPRFPRAVTIGLIALLSAASLSWLIWAATVHSQPKVSGQIASFEVLSDRAIAVTVTIQRADPATPVRCIVVAKATNFEEVGRISIEPGPRTEKLSDVKTEIKTFRRATSASVKSCVVI